MGDGCLQGLLLAGRGQMWEEEPPSGKGKQGTNVLGVRPVFSQAEEEEEENVVFKNIFFLGEWGFPGVTVTMSGVTMLRMKVIIGR